MKWSVCLFVVSVLGLGPVLSATSLAQDLPTSDFGGVGAQPDLYVTAIDGSETYLLTNSRLREITPAWSPDGNQILFAAASGRSDISVINADGSGLINLTNTPDVREQTPAWSPNGKFIAFSAGTPTTKPGSSPNIRIRSIDTTNIFVMDADGSKVLQLTDDESLNHSPKWSPDGDSIAFVSNRIDGYPEIFIMNADGFDAVNVTRYPERGVYCTDPTWSPNGQFIAFTKHTQGESDIYVVNADGSNPRALAVFPGKDTDPVWSPNGQWIAFVATVDRTRQIHLIRTDASSTVALTDVQDLNCWGPDWSPDGKFIVYQSYGFPENRKRSGGFVIWEGGGLSIDAGVEGGAAYRYGIRHEDGSATFEDLTEAQARALFSQYGANETRVPIRRVSRYRRDQRSHD